MADQNGWLSCSEVTACGLPVYITGGPGWRPARPAGWIFLPRFRCAELGAHVAAGEQPAAYLHVPKAIPPNSYAPLYARGPEQIDRNRLTPGEQAEADRGS